MSGTNWDDKYAAIRCWGAGPPSTEAAKSLSSANTTIRQGGKRKCATRRRSRIGSIDKCSPNNFLAAVLNVLDETLPTSPTLRSPPCYSYTNAVSIKMVQRINSVFAMENMTSPFSNSRKCHSWCC